MEGVDESHSFVFLRISKGVLLDLRKIFFNINIEQSTAGAGFFRVSIPTDEGLDIDKIEGFVARHSIPDTEFGVFMVYETEWDSRIIDVPDNLAELIRRIGGKLECAFRVI